MDLEPGQVDLAEVCADLEQASACRPRRRASSCASRSQRTCPRRSSPTPSGCSRSCATCCPTRSSSPTPAAVTLQIGLAPSGTLYGVPALDAARSVVAFAVERHRHRHPGRQAGADLRGVPAGRRHDQPQVRRHRTGPVDQPGTRPPAGRHDRGVVGARAGSIFTLLLPDTARSTDAAPSCRARRAAEALPALAERPAPILGRRRGRRAPPRHRQLAGATVLIVDDDVRNVFALTSALELHGIEVLYADNGVDGIRAARPSIPRSTSS